MKLQDLIACPTCLAVELERYKHNGSDVLYCPGCAAVFPVIFGAPRMIDIRSLMAIDREYFGNWYVSQLNAVPDYESLDVASTALTVRDDVRQVMENMDLNGKIVLDVGSGTCTSPEYVTDLSPRYAVGLDPIAPKQEPRFPLVGGLAEQLPFRTASVDVITLITSLDHVIDVHVCLAEFKRVLRRGGCIYVWVEFSSNPELWEKPKEFQVMPRLRAARPTTRSQAFAEYDALQSEYDSLLETFEKERDQFRKLLVDKYHFRHFNREAFFQMWLDRGLYCERSVNITYPSGTHNHFLEFRKLEEFFSCGGSLRLAQSSKELMQECALRQRQVQVEGHNQIAAEIDEKLRAINEFEVRSKELTGEVIQRLNALEAQQEELVTLGRKMVDGLRPFYRGLATARRLSKPFLYIWYPFRVAIRSAAFVIGGSWRNRRVLGRAFRAFFAAGRRHPRSGKRILMLTVSQIDIDPRVNKVAYSLADRGYDVDIFCPNFDQGAKPVIEEKVYPNVHYVRVRFDPAKYPDWQYFQEPFLTEAASREFDFVHVNDLTSLISGWIISRTGGRLLIYDSHEMWSENVEFNGKEYVRMRFLTRWISRLAEGLMLKSVDSFYSVSPSICKEYGRRYGREPILLPNVPDVDMLQKKSLESVPSVRELCGLSEKHFVTLYLGGLGPARNIENVIAAHEHLSEEYIFIIRGPDAESWGRTYRKLAKDAGVERQIRILPGVGRDDLLAGSKGADCGIVMLRNLCMNFYFFYPNKFFEYGLASLPVAVSNFPDVTAFVERERCGVTFDPEDPESIASAIRSLAEDRQEAAAMGKRGYAAVLRGYNWRSAFEAMASEYKRISSN